MLSVYTELEIEHIAWGMIRADRRLRSRLPIDVELLLESQAGLKLIVTAGLIERFSIEACACRQQESQETLIIVDRSVADSRPESHYRRLLAEMLGHLTLSSAVIDQTNSVADYVELQRSKEWPLLERDARRFATSLMVPEHLVTAAAEQLYAEFVREQGFSDPEPMRQQLRNGLAQAFAVTPEQLDARMVGWPCEIYKRVDLSIDARSPILLTAEGERPAPQKRQAELFAEPRDCKV